MATQTVAEQRIQQLAQEIIDLLPEAAGPVEHLAPQVKAIRNALLITLDQARAEFAQAPAADVWALAAAIAAVTSHPRRS